MASEPTVLIVGAGTFGTSTAYHLAHAYRDPSRLTVVDRSSSAPAASIDVNRIIRTDYPNSLYTNLACEAIHSWFWNPHLGPYFHKTGWLVVDAEGSDLTERCWKVQQDRGSTQSEMLDVDEVGSRWEALKDMAMQGSGGRRKEKVYFNPEAGWCEAGTATDAFMQAAIDKGVKRVAGNVTELLWEEGRVRGVRTAAGQTLRADKILLATGPWTSSLLEPVEHALDIPQEDSVESQIQAKAFISAYYSVYDDEIEQLDQVPVVLYSGVGEVVPPSKKGRLLKYDNSRSPLTRTTTTKNHRTITCPPPSDISGGWQIVPPSLQNETREIIVSKVLSQFTRAKTASLWRVCWDAVTPTEDWLVCEYPHERLSNVYLAVGGSFHGYK